MGKKKENNGNIEHILNVRFGEEKVEVWKRQFAPRKLTVLVVEDKVAVLRPVTAAAMSSYAMAFAQGGGMDIATRRLLEELWIDGDECMRSDEEYIIPLMLQIDNAFALKKSACYNV